MTPRTRRDLIIDVLDDLGVIETGQEPAAEDLEKVDPKIDEVFRSLARRDVLYVQDEESIDPEYFDHLSRLVANRVANKFGGAYSEDVERREEAMLRAIQRRPADSGDSSVLRSTPF